MIEIIIIGILSGFLVHFLNYTIGKPGSEKFSPYEIFSNYTVWLSKRRLRQHGLYAKYWEMCIENFKRTKTKAERINLKNDMRKIYYEAAEPFFTWERALGMCAVCFGFWISLIIGILFTKNIIEILIIIVTSHVTIRLLNKLI